MMSFDYYFRENSKHVWGKSGEMTCPERDTLFNEYISKCDNYLERIDTIQRKMNEIYSGEEKTFCEYLKENIMQGNVSKAKKELHSPYWYLKNEDSFNYASPEIINGMWTNFKQTIAWLDYLEKDFP